LSFSLLFGGCSFQKMLPEYPVMTPWHWSDAFADPLFSGAEYIGEPRVDFPILPVQVWGVAYELDLVLVSDNPKYDMHEFASIRTADGLLWIAKDAAADTLEQTIVTNLKNPEEWFPEIPVRRRGSSLEALGVAEGDEIRMRFAYQSVSGDHIRARYEGKGPNQALKKRNGSTMCHSRDALLAVLDLSHRNFGQRTEISYNGQRSPTKRLMGIVPFHMALQQTQGGLASGTIRQERPMAENEPSDASDDGFVTYYTLPGGETVSRSWRVLHGEETVTATQVSAYRTLKYVWRVFDGAYELVEAHVTQPGREAQVVTVRFQPGLPDMRRPFRGSVVSQMGIAVNGQLGLATGEVTSSWDPKLEQGVVSVRPSAPWWVRDRRMETTLKFDEEGAQISITMLGAEPMTEKPGLFARSPKELRFCD